MQDLGPPMAIRTDPAQGSSLDPFPWEKKNSLCWEWHRVSNFCWIWVFYSMYGIFFCSSERWEKNVYFSWMSKNPKDTQKKELWEISRPQSLLEDTKRVTGVSSSGRSSTSMEWWKDGMQEHSTDLLSLASLSQVGSRDWDGD